MASQDVVRNLRVVRERIAEAALRSGRDPDEVSLVAVSKTFPVTAVVEAIHAGQRVFGENRPEEGARKIPEVLRALASDPARSGREASMSASADVSLVWHMIGHVQSRKADLVVAHFDVVHSVDRLKLAQKLSRLAVDAGREMPVLLECNVTGEAGKYGYPAAGWEHDADCRAALRSEATAVAALSGLRIEGLMTVAPVTGDPQVMHKVFASLRGLRDYLREQVPQADWGQLSMGMTDDFEVAISEGATIVRIGRAIFGTRNQA